MAGWHRTHRTEAPDRSLIVEGQCPRCQHHTYFRVDMGQPGTSSKTPDIPAGQRAAEVITVICGCGYVHPDRPADSGESGCGAYWYDQES